MNLIAKYDSYKEGLPKTEIYGIVDKNIFQINFDLEVNDKLTFDEISLFIYLSYMSSRATIYNGKRTVIGADDVSLYKLIYKTSKLAGRYQEKISKIHKSLSHLKRLGLIKSMLYIDREDIIIPDVEDNYGRLSPVTVESIIKICKGDALLKHIGVYAAMKSTVYAGSTNTSVIEKNSKYIAHMLNTTSTTVDRHLKWLRDNKLICYFLCASEKGTVRKYYYADLPDWENLRDNIKTKIKREHIQLIA